MEATYCTVAEITEYAEENGEESWLALVQTALAGRLGWIGGADTAQEGTWRWVAGPEQAKEGDIVVFTRGTSATMGHVAFFLKATGSQVEVLGGLAAEVQVVASGVAFLADGDIVKVVRESLRPGSASMWIRGSRQ